MQTREYDLIVVGAAGYTGSLVVEQIAQCDHLLRDPSGRRRWAVSGRDEKRTRDALANISGGTPEVLTADLADAASLPALTRRANTIINLAGPYTPTAQKLIGACVETKTSYVDLSGEIPLLKDTISRFHMAAIGARIRIVQMSGWEALPADLTALLASRRAVVNDHPLGEKTEEGPGGTAPIVNLLITASFSRKPEGKLPLSEAVSAGTISSIVQMLESPQASLLGMSDALLPDEVPTDRKPAGLRLRPFTKGGRRFAPFSPVAFLNAPIVHRTAALRAGERQVDYQPGRYAEGDELGASTGAKAMRHFATAWFRTALQRMIIGIAHAPAPIRAVISRSLRKIIPAAGNGPTGRFQSDWEWTVTAQAHTADGRSGTAHLNGRGHPGYTATAAMIAEVGLRIALGRAPERFGCLTPALALGSLDLDPWFVDSLALT